MTPQTTIVAPTALAIALLLAGALAPALAQTSGGPPLGAPPARTYTPEQLGAISSANRYVATSAANDHGAFLWIIDTIERKVTLCERANASGEFTCNKKSLP
jgi:hypothetical protein